MKQSHPNGFTLLEALAALMVSILTASLSCMFLESAKDCVLRSDDHQNQFGILQIRQTLAVSQDVHLDGDAIVFIQNHEEYTFIFSKNRIVKTPGYEIFCENISDGAFVEEDGSIFVRLKKETIQLY